MALRRIAVIGIGCVRCGPAVTASLAHIEGLEGIEFVLMDANRERLDLFERLLTAMIDRTGLQAGIRATTSIEAALDDSTDVIVTLHEDCARRMRSVRTRPPEPIMAEQGVWKGDRNRPTSFDQLSPGILAVISTPVDGAGTVEDDMEWALPYIAAQIPQRARVVSLVRGSLMPPSRAHTQLMWPSPLAPQHEELVPHQVLRWLQGEASLSELMEAASNSPLSAWLQAGVPG